MSIVNLFWYDMSVLLVQVYCVCVVSVGMTCHCQCS